MHNQNMHTHAHTQTLTHTDTHTHAHTDTHTHILETFLKRTVNPVKLKSMSTTKKVAKTECTRRQAARVAC